MKWLRARFWVMEWETVLKNCFNISLMILKLLHQKHQTHEMGGHMRQCLNPTYPWVERPLQHWLAKETVFLWPLESSAGPLECYWHLSNQKESVDWNEQTNQSGLTRLKILTYQQKSFISVSSPNVGYTTPPPIWEALELPGRSGVL